MVLDSEGLWSVARGDSDDTKAVLKASHQAGVPVFVPTAVLAESLFGDGRDARAYQVMKKLQVVPLTDPIARKAATLKRVAGMAGAAATIDAIVVATSATAGGGIVLTSDVDDIRALGSCATGTRIRPVRVAR